MFVKMDCIVTVARCDLFCMLEEIGRDVGRLVAVCNMIWVFLLEDWAVESQGQDILTRCWNASRIRCPMTKPGGAQANVMGPGKSQGTRPKVMHERWQALNLISSMRFQDCDAGAQGAKTSRRRSP